MDLTAREMLIKYLDDISRQLHDKYKLSLPEESISSGISGDNYVRGYNEGFLDGTDTLTDAIMDSFKLCTECNKEMFHIDNDYMCIGCRSLI